ncbi:MAG: hypothetical protein Q8R83_10285 [Legionellaceae bacterium]|nr:hypothetical protein [Legionellaceae bacterium]
MTINKYGAYDFDYASANFALPDVLSQLNHQQKPVNLILKPPVSQQDLLDLVRHINEHSKELGFAQLSIHGLVSEDLPQYQALFTALNGTSLQRLDLFFESDGLTSEQTKILLADECYKIAQTIVYPLNLYTTSGEDLFKDPIFSDVKTQIINRVRDYNQGGQAKVFERLVTDNEDTKDAGEEIKLKQWMRDVINKKNTKNNPKTRDSLSQYVTVELTQVEEQQQKQDVVVNQVQEAQQIIQQETVETQEQQETTYTEELIDFKLFKERFASRYQIDEALLEIIRHEHFANMPKAIKFYTPAAAEALAKNARAFATFNASNPPTIFNSKPLKTANGELVLDVSHGDQRESNAFTPKPIAYDEISFLDIELPKQWVDEAAKYALIDLSKNQLNNLWIKYGDAGVAKLFTALSHCDELHSDLSTFIIQHYLNHFPHWSFIGSDEGDFYKILDKINNFGSNKLACLKEFLEATDGSPFDLGDLVSGFDTFWSEWEKLAKKDDVKLDQVLGRWTHKKSGNPLVYMERLLTILKNARDLNEQVSLFDADLILMEVSSSKPDAALSMYLSESSGPRIIKRGRDYLLFSKSIDDKWELTTLDRDTIEKQDDLDFEYVDSLGHPNTGNLLKFDKKHQPLYDHIIHKKAHLAHVPISLGNYDGYYASLYEEFKLIRKVMGFNYDPEEQDSQAYLPEGTIYKSYLNELVKYELSESGWSVGEDVINQRLLFAQKLYRYIGQQSKAIRLSNFVIPYELKQASVNSDMGLVGVLFLFFVAHAGYQGDKDIGSFLEDMDKLFEIEELVPVMFKELITLLDQGTFLNEQEGRAICASLSQLDSAESKAFKFDPCAYVGKLFLNLKQNKHATLRLIDHLGKNRFHFGYALDTGEYLGQNSIIAAFYHDDLLLFSRLLGNEKTEMFWAGSTDTAAIDRVKQQLVNIAKKKRPNNLGYAFNVIMSARNNFTYQQFITAFDAINELTEIAYSSVDEILKKQGFNLKSRSIPAVFNVDSTEIKNIIISLLLHLESGDLQIADIFKSPYQQLPIKVLREKLDESWRANGTKLTYLLGSVLNPLLIALKDALIVEDFKVLAIPALAGLGYVVKNFSDYSQINDLDKIEIIRRDTSKMVTMLLNIKERPNFLNKQNAIERTLETYTFKNYDYQTMYELLSMLDGMPERDYSEILKGYLDASKSFNNEQRQLLLTHITALHEQGLPSNYIQRFISKAQYLQNKSEQQIALLEHILAVFSADSKDVLLEWAMDSEKGYIETIALTSDIKEHRPAILGLFKSMADQSPSPLSQFIKSIGDLSTKKQKIITILAMSQLATSKDKAYTEHLGLLAQLKELTENELQALNNLLEHSNINLHCLDKKLSTRDKQKSFMQFIEEFEKAPFEERDAKVLAKQFDTSQVERVVNQFGDLNNDSAYPYQYRKQMMEAFLFINRAGYDLPVYNNKPAKDLSNEEIKTLFLKIKNNNKELIHLNDFQKRLYALGLIREAMYRATGEFPYSTQMLSLIDCMMHDGDVISNIDTGQGKSLIDSMKASLLWLESARVDITTSSTVDAQIYLETYRPFFSMLNITCGTKQIQATSPVGTYVLDGINVGTMSQLALFFAKAKVDGTEIGAKDDRVSLVMNESDYTVLDDRTVYRYAVTSGPDLIGKGSEWIYYAVNEFVTSNSFKNDTGIAEKKDIAKLRNQLKKKANELNVSQTYVNNLSDKKLRMLIESGIVVNYGFTENEDYVKTTRMEKQNGKEVSVPYLSIIMKDGKVNQETQYGRCQHQLLHARQNKLDAEENESSNQHRYPIKPESRTLISSNNKNMIDYYRSHKGFIWGSSGTVGSKKEIAWQYRKYGFKFSKVEPHQHKIAKRYPAVLYKNQDAQFKAIRAQLKRERRSKGYTAPCLVFFKNITQANAFNNTLNDFDTQLYTGANQDEFGVIVAAAKSGRKTITTTALGRNTNIKYDRQVGMDVIETFVGHRRGHVQSAGRTGREGSPGHVYWLLNKEELGQESIQDVQQRINAIQDKLEENAENQRSYDEDLYNILGYLLRELKSSAVTIDNEFFKTKWADFSEKLESDYYLARAKDGYNLTDFLTNVITEFNEITQAQLDPVKVEEEITHNYQLSKTQPLTVKNEVKQSDCTPADIIAYHFMENGNQTDSNVSEQTKAGIKDQLKQLFYSLDKKDFNRINKAYISFLQSDANKSLISEIRQIHTEVIAEFLTEQKAISEQTKGHWIKYTKHLNNMLSNRNYLLLFHGLMCGAAKESKPGNLKDMVKQSIDTLLTEYIEYSWFISSKSREEAKKLRTEISMATNLDDIVSKLTEKRNDNLNNKNTFGFFGKGKLDATLKHAVELAKTMRDTKSSTREYKNKLDSLEEELGENPTLGGRSTGMTGRTGK